MSLYDYRKALEFNMNDEPFYAFIMAAMIKADSDNVEKLRECWPETWDELQRRYNAPGGAITDLELGAIERRELPDE